MFSCTDGHCILSPLTSEWQIQPGKVEESLRKYTFHDGNPSGR